MTERQNTINFFLKSFNKNGLAAIHIAAEENYTEILDLLIKHYEKFNIDWKNFKDNSGKLPKEHLDAIQTYIVKKEKEAKIEQEKEDLAIRRQREISRYVFTNS